MRNVQASQASTIIGLQEAGGFKLPPAVLDASQRVVAAAELLSSAPPVVEALRVEDELCAKLLKSSLRRSDAAGIGEQLAQAEGAEKAALATQRVFRATLEHTERSFAGAMLDNAELIITGSLRPALEQVLAEARGCAKTLEHYGPSPSADSFLVAPKADTEAFVRLREAAARYAGIRRAQSTLELLGAKPEFDSSGRFAEMRDLYRLWPSVATGRSSPPWPTDPVARLLWLISTGAQVWLPLPSEQDSAARSWAEGNRARTAAQLGGVTTG